MSSAKDSPPCPAAARTGKRAVFFRTLLAVALLQHTSIPAAGGDPVVASIIAGECQLSVEASDNWPALRLRAGHPEHRPCLIDKASVTRVLSEAFAKPPSELTSRVFTSLAFGRLIDYPWLAQFLALRAVRDPGWDAAAGKPVKVHINRYVADVLSSPEIVLEIEAALREQRYRIGGVSVEKVLVGGFENVPQLEGLRRKGKIPFDAQVWFRLERY